MEGGEGRTREGGSSSFALGRKKRKLGAYAVQCFLRKRSVNAGPRYTLPVLTPAGGSFCQSADKSCEIGPATDNGGHNSVSYLQKVEWLACWTQAQ